MKTVNKIVVKTLVAVLWCVAAVGCVAEEVKQPAVSAAAVTEPSPEYYSMNDFPQQFDKENRRFVNFYQDKSGKKYIAAVRAIDNSDFPKDWIAVLYEFPTIKKTDIEFLLSKSEEFGYQKLEYEHTGSITLNGKRSGFGGIANKVCTLPFSVKFNVGNYVPPVDAYKNTPSPGEHQSGYEKSVMFFTELPTGLVNIYGGIYEEGDTLYVIDEEHRVIVPINKQVSSDDYCHKPHIFILDFNKYRKEFSRAVNFEGCRLDEPRLKSLIIKAKQEECK